MLTRHLILAKRLFLKYPLNTGITLSGLSLGLAGFILLALFVFEEYETDRFHSHYEAIYKVSMTHYIDDEPMFTFPPPAGLKNDLNQMPEIVSNTRAFTAGEAVIQFGDKKSHELGGIFIDSAWLEVFDFTYLNNRFDFVDDPGKIAISAQLAEKYFNDVDPLGQTIIVNGESYSVENIILPSKINSSINPSFLISYNKQKQFGIDLNAYNSGHTPYWIIAPNTSQAALEQKLQPIITEKVGEMEKVNVTPLKDYYFSGDSYYGNTAGSIRGNKKFYDVFIAVALILLVLAVINYVNLNTARATDRAKEVGIKKTIGAKPYELILQFLIESIIVTFIACLLAVGLIELFLPSFNELLVKPINPYYMLSWPFAGLLISLIVVIGLIAGTYPAFVLSSFKPSVVLKGRVESRQGKNWIRNTLISCQFAIATLLVFSCLVINKQMTFLTDFDLGLDSEQIVSIRASEEAKKNFPLLRQAFMISPGVTNVSRGDLPRIGWMYGDEINGQTVNVVIHHIDENYLATTGIKLLEGRNFNPMDGKEKLIINKTLRDIYFGDEETSFGKLGSNDLIGVVEDFQITSAGSEVKPLEMKMHQDKNRNIIIRVARGTDTRNTLASIRTSFEKFAPNSVFDYSFLDEEYDSQFKSDLLFLKLLNYFTYLSIFIGSIGLFGLAQFSFLKRSKELGIRKILGAPIQAIFRLMINELFKPVLIASIIGLPLGYYLLQQWLQAYANKIIVSWQFAVITMGVIVFIALIAILYQLLGAIRLKSINVLKE